jgi:peptidoglycan-associated lipoprotein
MKKFALVISMAVLLSACGSAVKLDNVPVVDKAGATVAPAPQPMAPARGAQSAVAPVDVGRSSQDTAMQSTSRLVYFDYDSYAIRPEFQSLIESHARYIKANKNRKVAIEGHTDERGGREYNLALGQRRAEAVRRSMGLLGVDENQIEAVSFGKEKPAVLGSTEEAMEKNRRAEIVYR